MCEWIIAINKVFLTREKNRNPLMQNICALCKEKNLPTKEEETG